MLDPEVFDDEIFGFHSQQSVEKTIKAWLSLAEVTYSKTHDLEQLFAMLEESGRSVPERFRNCSTLQTLLFSSVMNF